MSKTKVYDMKVLTDEQVEFETKEFTETIQRIIEIVENMSHEKLVYINRIDEEETTTWSLIHTDGLHEEVLSLCHIDEDFPLMLSRNYEVESLTSINGEMYIFCGQGKATVFKVSDFIPKPEEIAE